MDQKELREIDAQVAEKVFGKRWRVDRDPVGRINNYEIYEPGYVRDWHPLPHYSSVIQDAWEVVEKMREKKWGLVLGLHGLFHGCNSAKFVTVDGSNEQRISKAEGETVPLAICRAALSSVKEGEC